MPRILHTKEDSVTRGVLDKDVHVEHDLVEVTYVDDSGTPYTIFAHANGPFAKAEDAVAAHVAGTLHPFEHEIDEPSEPRPPAGVAGR